MTEPVRVEEKSLEELESEITCPICQEHYTEPKVLPCLHYYCKKCILKLVLRTQSGQPFHCPECRCEATLTEGGVDDLKTAFFMNRLKSKVKTLQRAHGKVEVKCELCTDSSNAEAFCRHCCCFICTECVQLHSKIRSFFDHEVATLEDLKHGRAKPIAVKEPPTATCEAHKEPLIIYCYDCSSLICQHCTLKDHLGHNYEFTKKAAPEAKTKLFKEVDTLTVLQETLTKAGEKVQVTALEIEAQRLASITNLHTKFEKLHSILEQREQELVDNATSLAQEKIKKLSEQTKTLSLASADLQSVVDYAERCASLSTDSELVSMETEIIKIIQQKVQEHSESGRSLEPVEEADLTVEVTSAEALQQLCLAQANITTAADPAKCTVDLTTPTEVIKPLVGTLTIRCSNDKPYDRTCKITCHIKSPYNGAATDCDIKKDGPGRYCFQYVPSVRGCHELTVLVNGQHIAGSPFSDYVPIHPTHVSKPIKIWTELMRPVGITANSKGEIIVSLFKGNTNIIKFDTEGKRVDLVKDSSLVQPHCIACDDEDNIFCIDNFSSMILTCDDNGDNIIIHDVELEKDNPGRSALAFADNKLFTSEHYSIGIIKVYNKCLQYKTSIKYRNMYVAGISVDAHYNLYISDMSGPCVQVLTKDGVHIRSISHSKKELKSILGLYVHNENVYVTDFTTSHCVFVFTSDGEYVTSFGQKGQKEGDFNQPHYVYVDKNGFIYVSDFMNNRIQCF